MKNSGWFGAFYTNDQSDITDKHFEMLQVLIYYFHVKIKGF